MDMEVAVQNYIYLEQNISPTLKKIILSKPISVTVMSDFH